MKHFYKICLIVGSVFLAVGLGVAGIGYVIGLANGTFYGPRYETETVWATTYVAMPATAWETGIAEENATFLEGEESTVPGEYRLFSQEELGETITSLTIDVEIAEVTIIPGDSFQVEVMDYIPENLLCEVQDGTLIIQDTTESEESWSKWLQRIGREGLSNGPIICVTIPVDSAFTAEELVLRVGSGSLFAEELSAVHAKIETGVGEIWISQLMVTGEQTDITVGTGHLTINYLNTSGLNVDCGVGEATISGDISGDCTLKCGIGSIYLATSQPEESAA